MCRARAAVGPGTPLPCQVSGCPISAPIQGPTPDAPMLAPHVLPPAPHVPGHARGHRMVGTLAPLAPAYAGPAPEAARVGSASSGQQSSLAQAVCGTWVLYQVSDARSLRTLRPQIEDALSLPGVVGLSVRFPWDAADIRGSKKSHPILRTARQIARSQGKALSIRFMAGTHTPDRVFRAGAAYYNVGAAPGAAAVRQRHRPARRVPPGLREVRRQARRAGRASTTSGCSTSRGTARTGPSSTTGRRCVPHRATASGSGSRATGS